MGRHQIQSEQEYCDCKKGKPHSNIQDKIQILEQRLLQNKENKGKECVDYSQIDLPPKLIQIVNCYQGRIIVLQQIIDNYLGDTRHFNLFYVIFMIGFDQENTIKTITKKYFTEL